MTNCEDSNDPTGNPNSQPDTQRPVAAAPSAPTQCEVPGDPIKRGNKESETAKELAREFKWIQPAQLIVNGVLAVIGIFALCIYSGQLKEKRKSTKAAEEAAKAASSAAKTADTTLKNQQQSFEIDQRPYMVCDIPVFSGNGLVADKPITANVTFKNIGRTPARRVATAVTLLRFDPLPRRSKNGTEKVMRFINAEFAALRDINSKSREVDNEFKTGTDIAPNATMFATNQNALMIPSEEFKKTESGAISLFYLGVVTYADGFGNLYETEFCALYFGTDPRIWHVCDNHNTIK